MTDYNDGKWHGWNGGECPVHPATLVEVVEFGEFKVAEDFEGPAADFEWVKGEVIAFRVTKPYHEPREYWVNLWGGEMLGTLYASREEAETAARINHAKTIRLREVTDE